MQRWRGADLGNKYKAADTATASEKEIHVFIAPFNSGPTSCRAGETLQEREDISMVQNTRTRTLQLIDSGTKPEGLRRDRTDTHGRYSCSKEHPSTYLNPSYKIVDEAAVYVRLCYKDIRPLLYDTIVTSL